MHDDDRLFAACARLARENGWPAERRERLARLLVDEGRRRALCDIRGAWSSWRALAEMLAVGGATGGTVTSDPDEWEVRVVALVMAEGLAPPW